MKKLYLLILFCVPLFTFVSNAQNFPKATAMPADAVTLQSPDGQLHLKFAVVDECKWYNRIFGCPTIYIL